MPFSLQFSPNRAGKGNLKEGSLNRARPKCIPIPNGSPFVTKPDINGRKGRKGNHSETIRRDYNAIRPLAQPAASKRGWTLDVLRVVHKIGNREFRLADAYAFDEDPAALHPDNMNIRPKIRQKLQVLRDAGMLDFVSPGVH